MKKCTKCGESKSLSEFSNSSSKKHKDGKHSWCKSCTRAANKAWRAANAEKINAGRREKYAANPEPIRECVRKRYWRDPEARRADTTAWRESNPEKCKTMARNWYINNAERAKAVTRARYLANRDACLEYSRARGKRHYIENKDYYFRKSTARRARMFGAHGKLSPGIRRHLHEKQSGRCVYCNCELGASPHLDHIIPLARGGTHSDENVQLLCQSCNLSKGAKMPDEFLKYREELIAIGATT